MRRQQESLSKSEQVAIPKIAEIETSETDDEFIYKKIQEFSQHSSSNAGIYF